jgi:GTP-binding protein Era
MKMVLVAVVMMAAAGGVGAQEASPQRALTAIEATIVCERDSHKKIIIGKDGAMLKRIGTDARKELEEITGTQIYLKLWVKVRKNWRDSAKDLKNFGYEV